MLEGVVGIWMCCRRRLRSSLIRTSTEMSNTLLVIDGSYFFKSCRMCAEVRVLRVLFVGRLRGAVCRRFLVSLAPLARRACACSRNRFVR